MTNLHQPLRLQAKIYALTGNLHPSTQHSHLFTGLDHDHTPSTCFNSILPPIQVGAAAASHHAMTPDDRYGALLGDSLNDAFLRLSLDHGRS